MTSTDAIVPPILFLSTEPLDDVVAAIESAKTSLAQAQDLEWVSVAAHDYQDTLADAERSLEGLRQRVGKAHDEWSRARTVARLWGQL